MLARSLPVGVIATALVLAPAVASAAPAAGRPQNTSGETYTGQAQVVLPGGQQASVSLGKYRGGRQDGWWGELELEVEAEGSGVVDLTDAQVDFSRSLNRASLTDVEVTLYGFDRATREQTEQQVTVSVQFDGAGKMTTDAAHGDLCWAMGATCQSVAVDASRPATVALALDGQNATGSGSLFHGQYLYVGATR